MLIFFRKTMNKVWAEASKSIGSQIKQKLNTHFPPITLRNNGRHNDISTRKRNINHFDTKVIKCIGGKGGNGFMLFRRERDQPMMGPDGGNGGNGGHVVVVGSKMHNTLSHLKNRLIKGGNGEMGKKHGLHGKSSADSIIKVPLGTLILDHETNEVIEMVTKDEQEVLVAAGGFGGYGNKHFQCSTSTYPSVAVPSKELRPLEERTISRGGEVL